VGKEVRTMFENIGGSELIVILLLILVFFGPKKIPEIGQGIGKGIREFRKAMRDVQDELKIPNLRADIEHAKQNLQEGMGLKDIKTDLENAKKDLMG
jgi:TatA/E family protein of Tat protein translocase